MLGAATIAEGEHYALELASIVDPGLDTVTQWIVHWGDGTSDSYDSPGVKSHQYANGPSAQHIVVDLRDEDGLHPNAGNRDVTVTNVAPVFSTLSVVNGLEGGPICLLGSIHDPGSLDQFVVVINWGDGTAAETYPLGAGQWAFDLAHNYVDDNPTGTSSDVFTITAELRDQDGDTSSGAAAARVFNVAPSIVALNATAIDEGSVVQVTGTIADPGVRDSFVLNVDWGDGTAGNAYTLAAQSGFFVVSHRYEDNPGLPGTTFFPHFTLTDDDLGSDGEFMAIEVRNVPPSALALSPPAVIQEGDAVTLRGTFHDPGTADSFVLLIDWGDGNAPQEEFLPAGSTSFNLAHTYLDDVPEEGADEYLVSVTLRDDDGGSAMGNVSALVANAPPVVTLVNVPSVVGVGVEIEVTALLVDAGIQDTFEYAWQLRKDGELVAESEDGEFVFTPDAPGAYVVSLAVTDDDQGVGTAVAGIQVVPCFLPGDTNADCAVNVIDLNNVRNNFGRTGLGIIDLPFNGPVANSVLDRNGVGTGFTSRLPGTGAAIAVNDPNLDLLSSPGRLLIKSANGSLSSDATHDTLETPAVLLEGIATGDLRLSLALQNVRLNSIGDELKLYVGESADHVLRAGIHGLNRIAVVSLVNGVETFDFLSDAGSYTPGDNLTLILTRESLLWRLNWVNLTNPAASGASPQFSSSALDSTSSLYAGIFAASPPAGGVPFTAFVDYFTFDNLTPIPGDANGNHVVEVSDLNAVRNNFGASVASLALGSSATQQRAANDRIRLPAVADEVFALLASRANDHSLAFPFMRVTKRR